MFRRVTILLSICAVVGLGACSGDSDDSNSNGVADTESDTVSGGESDDSVDAGSSSDTGTDTNGCSELIRTVCDTAADRCGSGGAFGVKVADYRTNSYTSKTRCYRASPIGESDCQEVTETAREACRQNVANAECTNNVVLKLDDRCDFN